MTAGCDLAAFLRGPRGPARMPLRPCCVAGLIGRGGSADAGPSSCVRLRLARSVDVTAAGPGATTRRARPPRGAAGPTRAASP